MTPFELAELILKEYGIYDGIQVVNDIIWDVQKNPRNFISKLSDSLEIISLENDKCPLCGEDLIVAEHSESRGEYLGFDSEEFVYQRMCSSTNCPYIIE